MYFYALVNPWDMIAKGNKVVPVNNSSIYIFAVSHLKLAAEQGKFCWDCVFHEVSSLFFLEGEYQSKIVVFDNHQPNESTYLLPLSSFSECAKKEIQCNLVLD